MTAEDFVGLFSLWLVVSVILLFACYEGVIEEHNAVFWPVALFKYLLRQLYLVLFTGWKQ